MVSYFASVLLSADSGLVSYLVSYCILDIRMLLKKQCKCCGVIFGVKKVVCVCGYTFPLKRKALVTPKKSKRKAMKKSRTSESLAQTVLRQTKESAYKSKIRTLETEDVCKQRKEQDKKYKSRKWAIETEVETMHRQEKAKAQMAKKELQRLAMKQWVCNTCDRTLSRGNMPLQAKANGLQLCHVPPELADLNLLELRLISLRVPFMKMVALPSGKQRSIHGPAVNVPSNIDIICNVLPRLPSETELVPLKLKRKLAYKGQYTQKRVIALRWLRANNPLYAGIEINDQWLEQAMSSDEEFFTSIVEQSDVDASDKSINTDADESMDTFPCNLPETDPLTVASNALEQLAHENGFAIHNVSSDGNCMFSAIAYQLQSMGICVVDSIGLRHTYGPLEDNLSTYIPFLSQPVASENAYSADTEPPLRRVDIAISLCWPG